MAISQTKSAKTEITVKGKTERKITKHKRTKLIVSLMFSNLVGVMLALCQKYRISEE